MTTIMQFDPVMDRLAGFTEAVAGSIVRADSVRVIMDDRDVAVQIPIREADLPVVRAIAGTYGFSYLPLDAVGRETDAAGRELYDFVAPR